MRRRRVATIVVLLVLVFVYLAPLFYWGTEQSMSTVNAQSLGTAEEYRSASCMTIGLGFTYWVGTPWIIEYVTQGQNVFGLQLGCSGPFPR